jgi:SAM-dependent methyltransferase
MIRCYAEFITPSFLDSRERVSLLDVGAADVNGSYRNVFTDTKIDYRGADLVAAEGVDIVLDDPYHIPVPDREFDIVISGQMLEHCEFFWLAFQDMVRVVKDDGFIFLIAPSAGPIHRYPVDCYRYYPDSFAAIAKYTKCHLHACWLDERGPWNDLVGVFSKQPPAKSVVHKGASSGASVIKKPLAIFAPADPADGTIPPGSVAEEAISKGEPYLTTLARVHETFRPELYVEIGVRGGDSLRLAKKSAIGIDPNVQLVGDAPAAALFHETSDEFFEQHAAEAIKSPVDLAFIDGLHLFEYALRDFMNIERRMSPAGLIVVDDIFPNHAAQGSRFRRTRVWCGDVWRLAVCLAEKRPDLFLLPLDCSPTGLLLIAGLDPANRVLWQEYNPTVRTYLSTIAEVPAGIIGGKSATSSKNAVVQQLLVGLKQLREEGADASKVRAFCDRIGGQFRYRAGG